MSFNDSPIVMEYQKITNEPKPRGYHWLARLMVDDKPLVVVAVLELRIHSDYVNGFADEVMIRLLMGRGEYTHHVYPNKENLKILLTRELVTVGEDYRDPEEELFEQQEFIAILSTRANPVVEGSMRDQDDQKSEDLNELMEVEFQLMNPAVMALRNRKVGGVFRHKTGMETLRYLLTTESVALEVDEVNKIKGVDIIKPDNPEIRKQIIIGHGTPLVDIGGYIQNQCGGIYNGGLGQYLHRQNWYIYPLYDTTRWEKEERTLTVVNIPEWFSPELETTYRQTKRQVIILATGTTRQVNLSELYNQTTGNGVRFLDARRPLNDYGKQDKNTFVVKRGNNNHEFMSKALQDDYNRVDVSESVITDNPFRERSLLAEKKGLRVGVVWHNSLPDLLHPGMPVKYIFAAEGEVRELMGTLVSADSYHHDPHQGIRNRIHRCHTGLVLHLDAEDNYQSEGLIN